MRNNQTAGVWRQFLFQSVLKTGLCGPCAEHTLHHRLDSTELLDDAFSVAATTDIVRCWTNMSCYHSFRAPWYRISWNPPGWMEYHFFSKIYSLIWWFDNSGILTPSRKRPLDCVSPTPLFRVFRCSPNCWYKASLSVLSVLTYYINSSVNLVRLHVSSWSSNCWLH